MRRLTVRDVMTSNVITASVNTPFKEVIRHLEDNHVSAVPVLDEQGTLVGVVSEADLLLKQGYAVDRRKAGWLATPHQHELATKAGGTVAGDLMTSPAVTVDAPATLVEAARLMVDRKVKRLPVLAPNGTLVGIVSRADLIKAFLRSDNEIREEIRNEVFRHVLFTLPAAVTVDVTDGVVVLQGRLDRKSSVDIAEQLVYAVDGVVSVVNELTYKSDNSSPWTSQRPVSMP